MQLSAEISTPAFPSENTSPQDSIAEQLPPVTSLGRNYALLHTPDREVKDIFVIVATQSETEATVSNGNPLYFRRQGDIRILDVEEHVTLSADKPVLVGQFVRTLVSDERKGDPAMTLMTPNEQFISTYSFLIPESEGSNHYVSIVITNADKEGLSLNGDDLDISWESVPGFGFVMGYIRPDPGMHTIEHSEGIGFGAYIFGDRDAEQCAYGYPAGMCLDEINPVSVG